MAKRAALLGLVCLLASSTAWAFQPVEDHSFEVPIPLEMAAPVYDQLSAQEASAAVPGWNAFTSERGAGWMVAQYRRDIGSPAAMFGPSFQLVDPQATDESIAQAATLFVSGHGPLLKADPSQLGPAQASTYLGKTQVVFPQTYKGLEVVGGRVEAYVAEGKLVLLSSEFYPGVNVVTTPALNAEQAEAAAIDGMTFDPSKDQFLATPRLVVYPMIEQSRPSYYLAYEIQFNTADPVGYWWTYVDASDGQVLTRTNHASPFDIPVSVTSKTQLNTAQDPEVFIPSEFVQITHSAGSVYADVNGQASVTVPLDQPWDLTTMLRGRYSIVLRSDGAEATQTVSGTPGTPLDIRWDNTNSTLPERDAYYSHNRVHDWLKRIDPGFTTLDYGMNCNINLVGSCNAFWNGSSINFYREGGGCVNMAQISDVVMHEYGHGISQATYSPGAPPDGSGMGEALGDIVAQTNTNDRYLGRGINNGSGFVRDGQNNRLYPGSECGGEVHCLGEILMGSMWRTRVNFVNTYGYSAGVQKYDLMYRSAWRSKQYSMPAFLTRILMADDNNANLNDGTPDWSEICEAFESHNLPCPAITQYVSFTHSALNDQPGTSAPYEVTSLIQAVNSGTLVADSLRIYYSTDGEQTWSNVQFTATGQPNEYHGFIPAQDCGTLVNYYLRGRTSTGVTGTLPPNAPLHGVMQFLTGTETQVLVDNCESDHGWTIGAPGDAATAGIWERVDPVGKISSTDRVVQPEDDHTADPGVLCFVTDGTGGNWPNGDVDGGATSILSPVYDFRNGGGYGVVEFWGFFDNEAVIDDTLRVSVTSNNGGTWHDLVKIYGQNANAWNYYKIYFTDADVPFTNQMRFRVRIADFNGSVTEGAVDDLAIRFSSCGNIAGVDAPTATAPGTLVVQANQPNPMRERTTIRFATPSNGPVSVELFDAGGRVVRTLAQGSMAAGPHTLDWDGRDANGHAVSSGVYYYRIQASGEEQTRKMLLVR